jgi:hypothetical protein
MKIKFPKLAKLLLLLIASFFAIYLAWYFLIMRDDLEYLFVWRHAFPGGPHYPPTIIIGRTIICFVPLWLIILMITWVVKNRRGERRAVGA